MSGFLSLFPLMYVCELKKQSAQSKELHWHEERVRPGQLNELIGISEAPETQ